MENEVRVKTVPRSKRVAFTGYRPQKMPFGFDEQDERCVDFKKRLRDTIESFIWQGYQHFISGGALGMDMYAAEAVLELKKQYPVLQSYLDFYGNNLKESSKIIRINSFGQDETVWYIAAIDSTVFLISVREII